MTFLRIVKEHGADAVVELQGGTLRAGRATSNQLRLDDPAASREHFELEQSERGWVIRDLGSRNGTVVNGVPLSAELALLPGDEITVGRLRLILGESEALRERPLRAGDPGTVMFEAPQLSRYCLEEASSGKNQEAAHNLVLLNEMAREFMAASEEQALLDRLAARMLEVFRGDRCAVVYRGGSAGIEVRAMACAKEGLAREVRISTTAARQVIDDNVAILINDVFSDERFRAQQSILQGNITSILCAPLFHQDAVFGLLYLDAAGRLGAFDQPQLALLSAFANLAAIKIDNLRLVAESIAKARMERELSLAAEIQAKMLPRDAFTFPGFCCLGFTRPCYEVGGDYFDFLTRDDASFTMTVADVSGKGASGALLMASVKSMLTALVESGVPLLDRVMRLNRYVGDNSTANKFVTFFHAEIDPEGATLRYCNAGHNPPILLSADGEVSTLASTGPILGMPFLALPFAMREVTFAPGATVIAFSDGVTEANNPDGEEYGEKRLVELVRALQGARPEAIRDAIVDDVNRFTGGAPPQDDVTLVIVGREPSCRS